MGACQREPPVLDPSNGIMGVRKEHELRQDRALWRGERDMAPVPGLAKLAGHRPTGNSTSRRARGGTQAMNFDFSDDLKELREQARKFLRERCSCAVVRRVLEGPEPY